MTNITDACNNYLKNHFLREKRLSPAHNHRFVFIVKIEQIKIRGNILKLKTARYCEI
jgi:hypothetical protein